MFNGSDTGSPSEMAFSSNYPIHKACRDGDTQTVSVILESNSSLAVNEDPFRSWTPLHWAAYFGKLDCVRLVASVVPNVVNIQSSRTFQTPVHCASEAGHPHCLLWLLQAGANPEVKDYAGETALHKASRMGNAECVSLLIASSCNPSVQNSNGQTPSNIAEISGYPAIAAYIRKSELGIGDFQHNPQNGCTEPQSTFGGVRFNRKRTRDMCEGTFKKIRTEDVSPKIPVTVNNLMNPMTTSVMEHEKLCRMEYGYSNSLFESMFSDFHGC